MRMAAGHRRRMLRACHREQRCPGRPGAEVDPENVRSTTMIHSVPRSVVSRLLSVATVLTLVGFAASVDLQPTSALASPAVSADRGASVAHLDNDNNDNQNHDGNDNQNHDGNDHDNNGQNHDSNDHDSNDQN